MQAVRFCCPGALVQYCDVVVLLPAVLLQCYNGTILLQCYNGTILQSVLQLCGTRVLQWFNATALQ